MMFNTICQYYVWLGFGNVSLCKGISSAFLSSEAARYPHFSLSGICIISVISHAPATLHVIRESTKVSLSPYLFKWPDSNLQRDVFWVETKWMFDTNNLYWGREKTDSLSDSCLPPSQRQILLVLPYGVSHQWWVVVPQALCSEQVEHQTKEVAVSAASALDLFLSLPPWPSASVEQASACAVMEMNPCWLAHGVAKGLRCIYLSVGTLS